VQLFVAYFGALHMNTTHLSGQHSPAAQPLPVFRGPWRWLVGTAVLALLAVAAQTAFAAPGEMRHEGRLGGMHGGDHMQGHHLQRMLDSVNATPEQRSQIKQLADAAQADMASQRSAQRKLHTDQQALFAQPTVDARAAETLRQQMQAQHEVASKRMLQLKLDISRVLSPQQRQQLAERMQKRRAMMERHHNERAALDQLRN
jgi:periplasmic protein CpxP/Spy